MYTWLNRCSSGFTLTHGNLWNCQYTRIQLLKLFFQLKTKYQGTFLLKKKKGYLSKLYSWSVGIVRALTKHFCIVSSCVAHTDGY